MPGCSFWVVAPADEKTVYELKRPFHLRIPVVILAVLATVGLSAWMVDWGSGGQDEHVAGLSGDDEAGIRPQVAAAAEVTRDACPKPGTEVDPAATSALRTFMSTASGVSLPEGEAEVQVSSEVAEQLDPGGGGAPVDRMTRIEGWVINGEQVASCVYSYWWDGSKHQKSLDLVLLDPVPGSGRSGSGSGASGSGEYSVTGWWRGEQEPLRITTIATLHFLEGGSTCGDPDQAASIGVEVSDPVEELTSTLEELLSGPATRTVGGQSMVPPDVQVLSVEVEPDAATVSVTGSDTDMLRCEGRAGFDQIEATVESYLRSTLRTAPPPASTTSTSGSLTTTTTSTSGSVTSTTDPEDVELDITVLVDGQESGTLRR